MATNREIVTDALVEISVLDADETASPEDAILSLRVMNRMYALLSADGIDLGYLPQDSLSDEYPLDEVVRAQAHYLLAMTLAHSFPASRPDPTLLLLADGARSQLQRTAVLSNMERSSVTHVPLGERSAWVYDIASDE